MADMAHIIQRSDALRHQVRFKPPGSDVAQKVQGYASLAATRRLAERIDALVSAKQNGDPPPRELAAWIDGMPAKLAARLVELGLLDRRRLERARPITEHISDYKAAVTARRGNTASHAAAMAASVRRIVSELHVSYFHELLAHDAAVKIDELDLAASTKRHYLVALGDFGRWMLREKRAGENPLAELTMRSEVPRTAGEVKRQHVRRPLTVVEFRRLLAYLDELHAGGGRYRGQIAAWTALDRKMIYWAAVCTAYRQNELRSLRRGQLFLDDDPPTIDLLAKDAKNRTAAATPIVEPPPGDFAAALRGYVAELHPSAAVFRFPAQRHSIVDMMRRDMDGAGISHEWQSGEVVDFHTLRTTAITWWLDEYGLPAKRVQILARLKTLALVGRYSRKLRLESFEWMKQGPRLVAAGAKERTA